MMGLTSLAVGCHCRRGGRDGERARLGGGVLSRSSLCYASADGMF